jgi:hypothetical protein
VRPLVGPLPEDTDFGKSRRLASIWNLESEMYIRPKKGRTVTPMMALVLFCLIIVVILMFLPAVEFSVTNPEARWVIFIVMITLLSLFLLRIVVPRAQVIPPSLLDPYSEHREEGPVERNLMTLHKAREGSLFAQGTLYLELKEAFIRRVMLRCHLSRAQVDQILFDPAATLDLVHDAEVAEFLTSDVKSLYATAPTPGTGVVLREDFYSRFSRLLDKLEMFE